MINKDDYYKIILLFKQLREDINEKRGGFLEDWGGREVDNEKKTQILVFLSIYYQIIIIPVPALINRGIQSLFFRNNKINCRENRLISLNFCAVGFIKLER